MQLVGHCTIYDIAFTTARNPMSRPCKRCVSVGKDDTCRDVEHKKRGRPKLIDKIVTIDATSSSKTPSIVTAAALTKTRVKAKYTKSASYKMPKKTTNSAKIPAENYIVAPQTDGSVRETDSQNNRPSSYPSHHEQERPTTPLSYRAPSTQEYRARPLSMHSEPSLPGDRDPFYYTPSSTLSSTTQIKRPQEMYSAPSNAPLVTVFLTMDLICARVSDESQMLWGYHPHDISNKSLYSIIANEDRGKMRAMLGLIKDAVFSAVSPNAPQHLSHFPFLESSSPVFYHNRPNIMSSSAPGSSEYTDLLRICHIDGSSDLFNVRIRHHYPP
ncbi:hypothetical protein BGZ65_002238 [Modicella reniformis]|uniref:PAS domain-containing protein n=1 Tax=Modicella reniformis TaxID=1440133 RepID=A0A9P6SNP1_9FUNG|nr:hypothetical protein BGZ65_002238 [Modicella reniformis]